MSKFKVPLNVSFSLKFLVVFCFLISTFNVPYSLLTKWLLESDREGGEVTESPFGDLYDDEDLDPEADVLDVALFLIRSYEEGLLTDSDIDKHRDTFNYSIGEVVNIDEENKKVSLKIFFSPEEMELHQSMEFTLDCLVDSMLFLFSTSGEHQSDEVENIIEGTNNDKCKYEELFDDKDIFSDKVLWCLERGDIVAILNEDVGQLENGTLEYKCIFYNLYEN